jgi:hypothetical protein
MDSNQLKNKKLLDDSKARLARALDQLEIIIRNKFEILMHENHKEVSSLLSKIDELNNKLFAQENEMSDLKAKSRNVDNKKIDSNKADSAETLNKINKTISALEEILEVKNNRGNDGNS